MESYIGEVRSHIYKHKKATSDGPVFEDLQNIIRIVGSDEFEVFYDVWWEHSNSWSLAGYGRAIYLRFPKKYFLTETTFLRKEPLTEKETLKFRPDLPHRLGVSKNRCWSTEKFYRQREFELAVNLKASNSQVQAAKLVIVPKGPRGGLKPEVVVTADNGEFFHENELLWKAHNIQSKYTTDATNGVGIYRCGISKGLPSYYLGGQYDDAGNNRPEK